MGIKSFWGKIKSGIKKVLKRRKRGLKKPSKRLPKTVDNEVLVLEEDNPKPQIRPRKRWATDAETEVSPIQAIFEFSGVQLSKHTQRAYKNDLQDFFAYVRTQNLWAGWGHEIDPTLIANYRSHLVDFKKLQKSTVTRKIAVVKSFFRWATARGWVDRNPAELVKSFPQSQDSKTGFLGEGEIEKLLGRLHGGPDSGSYELLAKVVIETLLMLGLRRSEACQILAGDLEYLDGAWLIKIKGKGDRERRLPIPPRLEKTWSEWFQRFSDEAPRERLRENPVGWLDWLRRHAEQPLFFSSRSARNDKALSTSEVARIVRKAGRRAGLVNRLSPHMLRASAITHALDQGASHRGVQQMAGWTSPLMITRYDKRRKDPKFSAVMNLKYAKEKVAEAALENPKTEIRQSPRVPDIDFDF